MKTQFAKTLQTILILGLAIFTHAGAVQAEDVDISRNGRTVYIEGTAGDDVCSIYVDGDEVCIEVVSTASDGDVDDTDKDYDLEDVDQIIFYGFKGNDYVGNSTSIDMEAWGGPGNDVLVGGSGDDELNGGTGFDSVVGNQGIDVLSAGPWIEDEQAVLGGQGADVFITPYSYSYFNFRFQLVTSEVDQEDFTAGQDVRSWRYMLNTFNQFSFF